MSLPIEERYRVRTQEIAAFSGCTGLVVGSGSELKRQANAAIFEGFQDKVISKCPEKDYGVKESAGVDAVQIAKEKADVVDRFLERVSGQDEIISAGDVVVVVWKPGDEVDQATYLSRPDRLADPGDPESLVKAQKEALTQAEMLYCNGSFFVVWHIGTNIRRHAQGWEKSVGIRIKAEMNELPKELISVRAQGQEALRDNSLVNLISLVAEHAKKVTIRNRAGKVEEEIEINPQDSLLQLLVLGCALPHALLAQTLDEKTPEHKDGTKILQFSEFDIMRSRE